MAETKKTSDKIEEKKEKSKVEQKVSEEKKETNKVKEKEKTAGKSKSIDEILSAIEKMTVLELSELVKALEEKFKVFKWKVKVVDGHNVEEVYKSLKELKTEKSNYPKVLIADTVKGKGVSQLENDVLCHIKSLKEDEINNAIKKLNAE